MALNRNISDFPDGSTAAGGDALVNQSGDTRKVPLGTAAYKSTGGSAGDIPVLDSNGRVARSDGGIPDAFPTDSDQYYGTNSSGQPGFFTIAGSAIPVWSSGNSYGLNAAVAASSDGNALIYRSTSTNNTAALTDTTKWQPLGVAPATTDPAGLTDIDAAAAGSRKVLAINEAGDALVWSLVDYQNMAGGEGGQGQVLTRTSTGVEWKELDSNSIGDGEITADKLDIDGNRTTSKVVGWDGSSLAWVERGSGSGGGPNSVDNDELDAGAGTQGQFLQLGAGNNIQWATLSTTPADGSITTAKLANNAVSTAKIADNAITTAKLADGAVGTADLAANAVETAKIKDGAVTQAKMASNAINEDQLVANAVSKDKVADRAIGIEELDVGSGTANQVLARNSANNGLAWVNNAGGGGSFTAATTDEIREGTSNTKAMTPLGYKPILDDIYTSFSWATPTLWQAANLSSLAGLISGWSYQTGSSTSTNITNNDVQLFAFDNNSVPGGGAMWAKFLAGGKQWLMGTTTSSQPRLFELVNGLWLFRNASDAAYVTDASKTPEAAGWRILSPTGSNNPTITGVGTLPCMIRNTSGNGIEAYVLSYTNQFQVRRVRANEPALKIADGSVTTAKLADDAVTNAKIADRSISTLQIQQNAVDWGEIRDNAVITSKINGGAVTSPKIANNAVTNSKLANNAVDHNKISASGKGNNKFLAMNANSSGLVFVDAPSSTPADGSITTAKLANGAVTTGKIATSAVRTDRLRDDAVTQAKIADAAVGAYQLASNAVTNAKMADNSVGLNEINAGSGSAGQALVRNSSNNGLDWATAAIPAHAVTRDIIFSGNITTTRPNNQQGTTSGVVSLSAGRRFSDYFAISETSVDSVPALVYSATGNVAVTMAVESRVANSSNFSGKEIQALQGVSNTSFRIYRYRVGNWASPDTNNYIFVGYRWT